MNLNELENITKEYMRDKIPTGPIITGDEVLKLIAVVRAAKEATKDGDMPEGFVFTKEDSEQYFNLRLAVDALEEK